MGIESLGVELLMVLVWGSRRWWSGISRCHSIDLVAKTLAASFYWLDIKSKHVLPKSVT